MTKKVRNYLIDVEVQELEEGGYLAHSPTLQGCHAEGETISEAMTNLEDVAQLLLQLRREDGFPLPEELPEDVKPRLRAAIVVAVDRD